MTQSDKAEAAARAAATQRIDPASVNGWGVDADPENDPTWPMRDRSGDDGPGMNWTRPPVQISDVEILQSVEHLRQPASVGTSTPPSGLSGAVRRQAFLLSESQWGHWLLLMLADRINTVEGILSDLGRGRFFNPPVELGIIRQSRSRGAALGTAALAAGLGVVAFLILARRRR